MATDVGPAPGTSGPSEPADPQRDDDGMDGKLVPKPSEKLEDMTDMETRSGVSCLLLSANFCAGMMLSSLRRLKLH